MKNNIRSLKKTTIWLLVVSIALVLPALPTAATETILSFRVENNKILCVGSATATSGRKCSAFLGMRSLDTATSAILRKSHELFPVFSLPNVAGYYLVFIARVPSKTPQSTGYCGAGYEDHLVLIEYDAKKTILRDDFLLQSCLNSVTLDNDGDDSILRSLHVNPSKHSIGFRWLADVDDRQHTLTIVNGKFALD